MTEKDLAATLREEAELFDEEDEDAGAEAVWVRPAPPRDPSQVYSVRIPVTELEKLRQVADHKGVTPSALMRTWVLLRLDAEYEAMLGICPRCGRPAPTGEQHGGEPWAATNLALVAKAGTPKSTGRKAAPAKAVVAKAAPKPTKSTNIAKPSR